MREALKRKIAAIKQPAIPEQFKFKSEIMEHAFEHERDDKYLKLSFCIALYMVLGLIWIPELGFGSVDLGAVDRAPTEIVKRKVLRPPPDKPIERVVTSEKKARKVPMPDLTPEEPEPIVEPEPPEVPDMVFNDDNWEIGIPDAPPPTSGGGEELKRVGMVGVESPIVIKRVQPDYPHIAAKTQLSGFVILEAVIERDGSVSDINILRGLAGGKFGFEKSAAEALRQWEFLPGRVNNKPTAVRMTLKVDFVLN